MGHCGFDASTLQSSVQRIAGDIPVMMVNSRAKLDEHSGTGTLMLINRVLDGRLDADGGIDLIAQLSGGDASPKMMLISNYADAQEQAEQAGAMPGFGKSDIRDSATETLLRQAIEA